MKKTSWFPAKVKPVRKGWYEVRGCVGFLDCAGMHWWSGKHWHYKWGDCGVLLETDSLPWRGVMK